MRLGTRPDMTGSRVYAIGDQTRHDSDVTVVSEYRTGIVLNSSSGPDRPSTLRQDCGRNLTGLPSVNW